MGKNLQLICPICLKSSRSDKLKDQLKSNKKNHGKTDEEVRNIINSLKQSRANAQEPAVHKADRHLNRSNRNKVGDYKCPKCVSVYNREDRFRKHLRTIHSYCRENINKVTS